MHCEQSKHADTIHRVTTSRLFSDQAPLRSCMLPADNGHQLHVQQWGRADGIPVLLLHGGPGSGSSPVLRRFFDPERYRMICPDQRGAGLSTPAGSIAQNTTTHLLHDLRVLRAALGIECWLVVGGSWGATLALAHALDQPDAVSGLLLRSSFLARMQDIDGFFEAAPATLVHGWLSLPELRGDALREMTQLWFDWEQQLSGALATKTKLEGDLLAARIARYRVQSHYLRHGCWLQTSPLLQRCKALPPVPTLLLHGTQDRICPPECAHTLHAHITGSKLEWAQGAGHDPTHPAMVDKMVNALATFAIRGQFQPSPLA